MNSILLYHTFYTNCSLRSRAGSGVFRSEAGVPGGELHFRIVRNFSSVICTPGLTLWDDPGFGDHDDCFSARDIFRVMSCGLEALSLTLSVSWRSRSVVILAIGASRHDFIISLWLVKFSMMVIGSGRWFESVFQHDRNNSALTKHWVKVRSHSHHDNGRINHVVLA